MRVVFMGTPEFALPSLDAVIESGHEVAAVVTQPDRPRGRGHHVQPTPVALRAAEVGLPLYKPKAVRHPEFIHAMRALAPDAVVLVAFGQLIPPELLNLPPLGCINLHPSLLPRHRGASPVHAPILAGESRTGVTTMYMDEGLDTGDIILQEEVEIGPWENAGDLHDRLSVLGARLLRETLDLVAEGKAPRRPQDASRATYAPKVQKVEIDWSLPAERVARLIRGLSPSPGAFTYLGDQRIKPLRAAALVDDGGPEGDPGEIVGVQGDALVVACGAGRVAVTELQPEGKRPMSGADFARGQRLSPGRKLGVRLDSGN